MSIEEIKKSFELLDKISLVEITERIIKFKVGDDLVEIRKYEDGDISLSVNFDSIYLDPKILTILDHWSMIVA